MKDNRTQTVRGLSLLFAALALFAAMAPTAAHTRPAPSARGGVIDLREWDFSRDGAVPLSGEWRLLWMKDCGACREPGFDDRAWETVRVPGSWSAAKGTGEGFAWMRLRVILPPPRAGGEALGLDVSGVSSAYILYANGAKVMESGVPGNTRETTVPQLFQAVAGFERPGGAGDLIIALKVSNFHHARGGVRKTPLLGIENRLAHASWLGDMMDIVIMGILLMMGLHQMLLWLRRREFAASLYFSICCLMILMRVLSVDNFIERMFPLADLFEFRYKVEYLTIAAGTTVFITFFHAVYPAEFRRVPVRAVQIAGAALTAVTLALPARIYSHLIGGYYAVLVCGCVFCIASMGVAIRRQRPGAILMMTSFVLFFLAIVNDILYTNSIIQTANLAHLGLLVIVFSQSELLSRRFADALAAALRSEHIEEQLEIARLIQNKILPQELPEVGGFRHAMMYLPMEKVGGDFYDCFSDGDRMAIIVADVSGHGLPGAFLSLMTKMALERSDRLAAPGAVMRALNGAVCRSAVQNNFVTAFYGVIDLPTRVFRYSNAGHVPPFLYRPGDDRFIDLTAKGTALGWFDDLAIEEREIALKPGDRIVFYTDGITECRNRRGAMYGEERLKKFIREHVDVDPGYFSGLLIQALKRFSKGENFDDDLTMIVLDVL